MNTDKLNELTTFLLDTAKDTKGFVLDQAPEVAREIIAWGWWSSLISVIVGVVTGMVAARCAYMVMQEVAKPWKDRKEEVAVSRAVIGFFFLIVSLSALGTNTGTLIQTTVAPKLYLLEYVTHLIGK